MSERDERDDGNFFEGCLWAFICSIATLAGVWLLVEFILNPLIDAWKG